ncbi:MAG: tripartite tricarboxylate transporter TctB family protein [Syntrophales bacterium]
MMRKAVLIEGIVMSALASFGILEAIYIMFHKDPNTVAELVGPGSYILILAVPLLLTGLFHIWREYRKGPTEIAPGFKQQIDGKLIGIFLITSAYIYLIGVIGYLFSSLIFFIFAFKLSGVERWRNNLIISFVLSGLYYVIFVKMCDLIFPRSIFFAGF